jgi:hypothetical protein
MNAEEHFPTPEDWPLLCPTRLIRFYDVNEINAKEYAQAERSEYVLERRVFWCKLVFKYWTDDSRQRLIKEPWRVLKIIG